MSRPGRRALTAAAIVTGAFMSTRMVPAQEVAADTWLQWRGPTGTGSAVQGNPPVEWSEDRNVRWKVPVPGTGSASPIVWRDKVFVFTAVPAGEGDRSSGNPLTWLRRRFTGDRLYGPERLPAVRSVYASPVAVADRLYIASREGTVLVIRAGSRFEVLAHNVLDDGFDAAPAIVRDKLFLRGHRYLHNIASPL